MIHESKRQRMPVKPDYLLREDTRNYQVDGLTITAYEKNKVGAFSETDALASAIANSGFDIVSQERLTRGRHRKRSVSFANNSQVNTIVAELEAKGFTRNTGWFFR